MTDESDDSKEPMEALVGIVAVVTLPLTVLAGVVFGDTAAGVVAVTGWLLLVPVLAILADHGGFDLIPGWGDREADAEQAAADPVDRLRDRYAAGELDDVEFERRLERLLETEGIEVAGDVDPNDIVADAGEIDDGAADGGRTDDDATDREFA